MYRFHYMAVGDNRQRLMPLPDDRLPGRGEELVPPEAVLLVNPVEPQFKGEVLFIQRFYQTRFMLVSIIGFSLMSFHYFYFYSFLSINFL